jgi:hypothetical protein
MDDHHVVEVVGWDGPWPVDDPDANFKADVALYARVDPLTTLRNLGDALDIPVGGLCHYVLAKWATEGSAALLEIGPAMVRRLGAICDDAEAAATDEARLEAYAKLRGLISWLRFPLDHPEVYPDHTLPAGQD